MDISRVLMFAGAVKPCKLQYRVSTATGDNSVQAAGSVLAVRRDSASCISYWSLPPDHATF